MSSLTLSSMQESMYNSWLSDKHSGNNIEQIVTTPISGVQPDLLQKSTELVIFAYESLHQRYESQAGQVKAYGLSPCEIELTRMDGLLEEFLVKDRVRGFDLHDNTPCFRLSYLPGERGTIFAWTFHHMSMDGRSFSYILREILRTYRRLSDGEKVTSLPYCRLISNHENKVIDKDFWREYLGDFSRLPTFAASLAGKVVPADFRLKERSIDITTTNALGSLAHQWQVSVNNLCQGLWLLSLARVHQSLEVGFGAIRACASKEIARKNAVGCLINTLPFCMKLRDVPLKDFFREVHGLHRGLREVETTPLLAIYKEFGSRFPMLYDSVLLYDYESLEQETLKDPDGFMGASFRLYEQTGMPMTLYVYGEDGLRLKLSYNKECIEESLADAVWRGFLGLLGQLSSAGGGSLFEAIGYANWDKSVVKRGHLRVPCGFKSASSVIDGNGSTYGEKAALIGDKGITLSYGELKRQSDLIAFHLIQDGLAPGELVGLKMERSIQMVIAMLGIMKAGGAYLPMDPEYPKSRLQTIMEDSGIDRVLSCRRSVDGVQSGVRFLCFEDLICQKASEVLLPRVEASSLAYVIYTSGSTGRPKGVKINQLNLFNFFEGMDKALGYKEPGTFLAVTSISFDIAVLELLWTLSRGFTVVLGTHIGGRGALGQASKEMDFSLFFFGSDSSKRGDNKGAYDFILNSSRYADRHGFKAIWTPERHFHRFGGLFPNPSVLGAAIAAQTEKIEIRAGSCVAPLHHPVRIAEEWSVVDNLSGGRVGVSFATGWQPRDFVISPESYEKRKALMEKSMEDVAALWRGEAVSFEGPQGSKEFITLMPPAVQKELPIWVTASGNPETYRMAGLKGAHLLTHLLGQEVSELADKLVIYREALKEAGYDAKDKKVTLMLHTFLGDSMAETRKIVRGPMTAYLKTAADLIKPQASAFSTIGKAGDKPEMDRSFKSLSPEELEALAEQSFERYFASRALFGTVESCALFVQNLKKIGVTEVSCLVDFGVPLPLVTKSLEKITRLKQMITPSSLDLACQDTAGALIKKYNVTHFQCTPSLLQLLTGELSQSKALETLEVFCVGGEALPASLAREVKSFYAGKLINMYGPTETSIWSSTSTVEDPEKITIGRPIVGTDFAVLGEDGKEILEVGGIGELAIGGYGVSSGYYGNDQLTKERFRYLSQVGSPGFYYLTGDLVRRLSDGSYAFVGRRDSQVKVNGYRVELDEISHVLMQHKSCLMAVTAFLLNPSTGKKEICAYVKMQAAESFDARDMMVFCKENLPHYMVPSRFVEVFDFPMTPNGKIDRRGLLSPFKDLESSKPVKKAGREASREPLSLQIEGVFKELLGIDSIAPEENFFDLGAHSLLLVQALSRLQKIEGLEGLTITSLFQYATLSSLCRFIQKSQVKGESGPRVSKVQKRPLSARERRKRARQSGGI